MIILNWNCRGIIYKRRTIELLSQQCNILCLSETKLNQNSYLGPLRNFYYIRKDSSNPNYSGGLITYINKNIKYDRIMLPNISNLIEYIAIKIRKNEEEILLVQT